METGREEEKSNVQVKKQKGEWDKRSTRTTEELGESGTKREMQFEPKKLPVVLWADIERAQSKLPLL